MAPDHARKDLESLPLETLHHIASHLDSHRPSLYAFGLTSRFCHRASLPSTFREIHLMVQNPATLQKDVKALTGILGRGEHARHVRCLKIKGFLRLSGVNYDVVETSEPNCPTPETLVDTWGQEVGWNEWHKSLGLDEILPDEEFISLDRYVCYNEAVIRRSSPEDLAWAPVASLIHQLPCLDILVYNCRNQFAPNLLDALHVHPRCKLQHLTFRLRSLHWDPPNPYEMALATSPRLVSVKFKCAAPQMDSTGDDDWNQPAMMELVTGLAPSLKEVVVLNMPAIRWHKFPYHRRPWRGLPGFVPGRNKGSLKSLSLLGPWQWHRREDGANTFSTWSKHTDFDNLQHLKIGGGFHDRRHWGIDDGLMEWIVENHSFHQLKSLSVCMGRYNETEDKPDYASAAMAFFKAFEPLEELSAYGPLEHKIVKVILSRHGSTLKKLVLYPSESPCNDINGRHLTDMPLVFGRQQLLQIQVSCPALQELAVTIKRTKSDAVETEMYRTFGKMERLNSLFLTLDCSNWRVTRDSTLADDSFFDEFDHERFSDSAMPTLKIGHVRETLINSAVDEALARSIWATICQAKIGESLESLKLWTSGAGEWGNGTGFSDLGDIFLQLGRSWLIERIVGDVVTVRELGRRARETRDQQLTENYKSWSNSGSRSWDLSRQATVFRRIWPPKEDSSDWREDWASFPLQM